MAYCTDKGRNPQKEKYMEKDDQPEEQPNVTNTLVVPLMLEDLTRPVRIVVPLKDINILIRHWVKKGDAAAGQHDQAGVVHAMMRVQALQDVRISHGLEPLDLGEKKPKKENPAPTNRQGPA